MAAKRDMGLCLSGGGYRAMLFHAGALRRLNEAGLLPRFGRISSVSGGSIAAGVLATGWDKLTFDADGRATNFDPIVLDRLMKFGNRGMDINAVVGAAFVPGRIASRVARLLDKRLFNGATLGDLSTTGPEFVFCATNLQYGTLWYFRVAKVGDYESGFFRASDTKIATAVGASAAFPPFLSPVMLKFPNGRSVRLSDGGVYDNLGLEPLKRFNCVLASDGGQPFDNQKVPRADWIFGSISTSFVVDYAVRRLRRGHLVADFATKRRRGTYWGIATDQLEYVKDRDHGHPLEEVDLLRVPHDVAKKLATISTRLARVDQRQQRSLVNWGYAVCDTALRKYVQPMPRGAFPFNEGV